MAVMGSSLSQGLLRSNDGAARALTALRRSRSCRASLESSPSIWLDYSGLIATSLEEWFVMTNELQLQLQLQLHMTLQLQLQLQLYNHRYNSTTTLRNTTLQYTILGYTELQLQPQPQLQLQLHYL